MKNKLKENKAITLIALIITIIVLLILAGIVLNLVLGENGVLRKANWSSFTTEYSQIQESSNLYYMNKKVNDYGSKSKLASQTQINTNGKNKAEYYAIEESQIKDIDEESLIETIREMEGLDENADVTEETELYKLDFNKLNYKGKNEYIVNIKSGRVYRYDGFDYEKKIYHVPELALEKNGLQIKIANEQVTGDYQFWKTSGAQVGVSFDVRLPEELKDGQVTVENPESTNATITGNYNNGKYTGTITTKGTENPNGSYVYKIIIEKDGEKYEKLNNVNVNKFLDDPKINQTEEGGYFTLTDHGAIGKDSEIEIIYDGDDLTKNYYSITGTDSWEEYEGTLKNITSKNIWAKSVLKSNENISSSIISMQINQNYNMDGITKEAFDGDEATGCIDRRSVRW